MPHDEFSWIIPAAINLLKSLFSGTKEGFQKRKLQREQMQEDYVYDSVGDTMCLNPDCYEEGTVSFDTVDLRVRLRQKQNPKEAQQLKIPDPTDPKRKEEVRNIIKRLEEKQRLKPGKQEDRWKPQ